MTVLGLLFLWLLLGFVVGMLFGALCALSDDAEGASCEAATSSPGAPAPAPSVLPGPEQ
jgi:hypothetical protein